MELTNLQVVYTYATLKALDAEKVKGASSAFSLAKIRTLNALEPEYTALIETIQTTLKPIIDAKNKYDDSLLDDDSVVEDIEDNNIFLFGFFAIPLKIKDEMYRNTIIDILNEKDNAKLINDIANTLKEKIDVNIRMVSDKDWPLLPDKVNEVLYIMTKEGD